MVTATKVARMATIKVLMVIRTTEEIEMGIKTRTLQEMGVDVVEMAITIIPTKYTVALRPNFPNPWRSSSFRDVSCDSTATQQVLELP